MFRLRLLLTVLSIGFVVSAIGGGVVSAAENISGSYDTATPLVSGTMVSLANGDATIVEATNTSNASKILGVVVSADNSLIAVNPDDNKVQVATTGSAYVMATSVNGTIKAGDKVAVSPFSGVGMRAVAKGYIIGIAQEDFASSLKTTKEKQVTDKSGKQQAITVGYVKVAVTPRYDGREGEQSLNGLQSYVRSLTGHVVSMPRIVISAIITVVTIIGVGVLLYASIYGSIMSIGRNPLAKNSILAALSQSLIMAVIAVGLAFLLIFMLLR